MIFNSQNIENSHVAIFPMHADGQMYLTAKYHSWVFNMAPGILLISWVAQPSVEFHLDLTRFLRIPPLMGLSGPTC